MKSLISIVLVLVMLFSFAACSGGSADQPKDTTVSNDTTASNPQNDIVYEEDDLPDDLRFGGEKITFLLPGQRTLNTEIFTDELNSDVVNDSVYNREKYVEDRLDVELEAEYVSENEYEDVVEKQHASDDDIYQVLGYITFAFTRFVFTDYFNDLNQLNYIDLEKPWWSQTFNEEAEIMDMQFVATGSLALSLQRSMFAVFYNKTLADNYSDKYPELNELYDIVDRGEWTYDKFYELGSEIYVDNNGDDLKDMEDTFGIGFQGWVGADVIWSSFDIDILSHDEEGWFELAVPVEKMYSSLERIHVLLNDTTGCFDPGHGDENLDDLSAMMAADNLLFMSNTLDAVESATMRNMQSDYGILPFPKYDDKQDNYYTYAHDSYTSFAIPKTCRNTDAAAAVLEALASYSYRETNPNYFNVALKGKYMSDPQSRMMLDTVVNGFKVDAAWIYLETLGSKFPSSFRPSSDTSYATSYAKLSKQVTLMLKLYKSQTSFS